MRISDNFNRDEFLASDTARNLGYRIELDKWTLEQIERLVHTVLQPARDVIGLPFNITSGLRPPWLNKVIRGSKDSRHMYGCAADFVVPGADLREIFFTIKAMDLPIDQLILEQSETPGAWIHAGIALPGTEPRKQYMIATRGSDGAMQYSHVE